MFYSEHFASSEGSVLRTLVMLVTYGPLLVLLVVRLVQWRRFPVGPVELLLAVPYISAAFVYAVFHWANASSVGSEDEEVLVGNIVLDARQRADHFA